jgi:hypothetical protein
MDRLVAQQLKDGRLDNGLGGWVAQRFGNELETAWQLGGLAAWRLGGSVAWRLGGGRDEQLGGLAAQRWTIRWLSDKWRQTGEGGGECRGAVLSASVVIEAACELCGE